MSSELPDTGDRNPFHKHVEEAVKRVDVDEHLDSVHKEHQTPTSEWSGKNLWENTHSRPLELADIEGEGGVEDCYQKSLIPDVLILALRNNAFTQLQTSMKATRRGTPGLLRGGMLHPFRQTPEPTDDIKRYAPIESVYAQMVRLLAESQQNPDPTLSKKPSIYEGAVLVPKGDPRPVLAWGTWLRSRIANPTERTADNDQYVFDLIKIIQSIEMFHGLHYEQYVAKAHKTLLFDTLNGGVPGSASVLWTRQIPLWKELGFSRILLYRHQILQVVSENGIEVDDDRCVPLGNNDESEEFLKVRAMRGIGTRSGDLYAVRDVAQGNTVTRFLIRSIEGWMYGDLDEVQEASERADESARRKFGLT